MPLLFGEFKQTKQKLNSEGFSGFLGNGRFARNNDGPVQRGVVSSEQGQGMESE